MYFKVIPLLSISIYFSGFPWNAGFYKILNHISLVMNNGTQADLDLVLTKIYHTDTPNMGDSMNFDVKVGLNPLSLIFI